MKKLTAIILALILLLSAATSLADEWVCSNCGKTNTTAFCTGCGTKHETWICPNCGAENSDAFCGNCGISKPVNGMNIFSAQIETIEWVRTTNIEERKTFNESGWELPSGAIQTETKNELHHYDQELDHYEDVEVQRSRQVIDHYETYYTYTDNGNGVFSEVPHERPVYNTEYYTETVKQPVYKSIPKYATKYYYNITRWMPSRDVTLTGDDNKPQWPEITLAKNEREGQRTEAYRITLTSKDTQITGRVTQELLEGVNPGDTIYLAQKADDTELFISDQYGQYLSPLIIEEIK